MAAVRRKRCAGRILVDPSRRRTSKVLSACMYLCSFAGTAPGSLDEEADPGDARISTAAPIGHDAYRSAIALPKPLSCMCSASIDSAARCLATSRRLSAAGSGRLCRADTGPLPPPTSFTCAASLRDSLLAELTAPKALELDASDPLSGEEPLPPEPLVLKPLPPVLDPELRISLGGVAVEGVEPTYRRWSDTCSGSSTRIPVRLCGEEDVQAHRSADAGLSGAMATAADETPPRSPRACCGDDGTEGLPPIAPTCS